MTPGQTTTWPWTGTPASSRARSQRRLVAPRRLRSISDRTSGSVAWMRHVERRQALGDHPLEVGLGEPGQRGEVPVEEGQAVVVVLLVEAAAQPRRELVDEAELAVVVAGAHGVEDGRRRPRRPTARPPPFWTSMVRSRPPRDTSRLEVGVVGQEPVADDVAGGLAVEGHAPRRRGRNPAAGRPANRARQRRSGERTRRHRLRSGGTDSLDRWPVDRVLLAAPRGFCAGVEMAIKALAWMVRAFEPPVYCYHEIVHNQRVVERFRGPRRGVRRRHRRGARRAGRSCCRPTARPPRWSPPPGPTAATWSTPSARWSPRSTTR